jgi:Domain of unknown function (DUF4872)/Butirosin biosynthesis protein H, N-terminal
MKIEFEHKMAAHCENGVISNLLRFYGIELSEPMTFGIGSGIFFSYLPFLKYNGIPVTTFRPMPGVIFRNTTKALGIKMHVEKFRNPGKAMLLLDKNLENGIPTGMVVGVFHLTYFPAPYRFHFNAHNIIAFGKEDNNYMISDPVMENIETISFDDLKRVRYAQGIFKPKGKMYYIESVPVELNLNKAIIKGLNRTVTTMVKLPGPIMGVTGMKFLSKRLRKWPAKLGEKEAARFLGQIVRMQEEIGTGGAGFRFLFAAFLQEAAEKLQVSKLNDLSMEMTAIGDKWREFSVISGRICKGRENNNETYDRIADLLNEIAEDEKHLYLAIDKTLKKG